MKLDPNVEARPILRAVDFNAAARFSPWPARLMELEPWQKKKRDAAEVLREYNDGWYKDLLAQWDAYAATLDPAAATPAVALRFFYRVMKRVSAEVEKNKAIYRSSQDQFLFSAGDQFLVGDLTLGNLLHFDLIVRSVDKYLSQVPLRTIVEPGCGTGVNLFHLHAYLDIERIVGGDICSNAVTLASRIAQRLAIPGEFHPFDYRERASLENLTRGLKDYLLLTCHSIEQIQVTPTGFIENILTLPNPPGLVLHCEPVIWDDATLMGGLCKRYAEKNGYNLDLVETLARGEREGRLEILDCQKRCFGLSAFNPTSLICWRPRR